jgi:hypothetical protein
MATSSVKGWQTGLIVVEEILYDGIQTAIECAAAYKFAEIDPIPLTSEWLERMGLKQDHTKQSWFHRVFVAADGRLQIEEYQDTFHISEDGGVFRVGPDLKYVHQLQNLFFALTGQELAVKEIA